MNILKEEVLKSISSMPEGATIDDIMYRLYVVDRIVRGEKDVALGKTISQEELERKIEEWK